MKVLQDTPDRLILDETPWFLALTLVERLQVIFDRKAGTVTIRRKSLLRYKQVTHALQDVSHAELETTVGSKGTTLARPVLLLTGGMSAGRHPLVTAYSNLSGPPKMVAAINAWL